MYSSENEMVVTDALQRMDAIFQSAPLPVADQPKTAKDASIELDHVTFAYQNTEKNVLRDISMTIPAGSHVALVGPSGSGKSTLASLIARFHDVSEGELRIGTVPVKEIAEKELMNTVSFVFQDSHLLKMSILENVRLGKPEATREEVLQTLHEAQCDDILAKFPEGVDTVIGAKGVYVSGGEAQRISIARAMLKNASILILDEATAFADPDNEVRVQEAFARLSKGKDTDHDRASSVNDRQCRLHLCYQGRNYRRTGNSCTAFGAAGTVRGHVAGIQSSRTVEGR